jgi:glycosyltransferase involved in cell wall biosynthesis
LVHFHLDYYPFSAISRQVTPFLTTLHGRLSPPEHQPVFSVFSPVLLVSISNSQRRPISNANWIGTVHGLPINLLTPRPVCPSYLALALLVPIDWPEPFGLVMIEAMAFGTPVIAFNRGSVPEVIEDGLTGYLVEDETSAIGAVCGLQRLSRSGIRSDSKSDLRLDHGRVVFGDIHAID